MPLRVPWAGARRDGGGGAERPLAPERHHGTSSVRLTFISSQEERDSFDLKGKVSEKSSCSP